MIWSDVCAPSPGIGRILVGGLVGKGGGPPIGTCGKSAADWKDRNAEVADWPSIGLIDELAIDVSDPVGGGRLSVDISDEASVEVL
jgi:hypothetical protein